MAPMNKTFIDKVDYKKTYDSFKAICDKYEVTYIDFNLMHKELGLTDVDFADEFNMVQHMNKYGAEKVSNYMANYLKNIK